MTARTDRNGSNVLLGVSFLQKAIRLEIALMFEGLQHKWMVQTRHPVQDGNRNSTEVVNRVSQMDPNKLLPTIAANGIETTALLDESCEVSLFKASFVSQIGVRMDAYWIVNHRTPRHRSPWQLFLHCPFFILKSHLKWCFA